MMYVLFLVFFVQANVQESKKWFEKAKDAGFVASLYVCILTNICIYIYTYRDIYIHVYVFV